MISMIATVSRVSFEVIVFCVLWSPMKNIEPFWGLIWLISVDVLQLVLKGGVLYVSVVFYEDIPLEFCWIFESTNSDKLSHKSDIEEIIFCS